MVSYLRFTGGIAFVYIIISLTLGGAKRDWVHNGYTDGLIVSFWITDILFAGTNVVSGTGYNVVGGHSCDQNGMASVL